ncbi:conserved hypothetical protein [Paecilomyces variotii No. 5]|uniref:Mus7/MMS22 family-domain-containing protein n=1 Tax=Byssochlamys spectabilis (strain No. 5 / NBRC 109023) TaxID=1356009 RepID=V5FQ63_BYSSN|nr:conserved hypothetical protein [Paecilomyces variotii No. 5]
MKSWREQGFVPDSDDEDDFDTQGSKKQEKEELYGDTEQDVTATFMNNDHENIDTQNNNDDGGNNIENGTGLKASMELDSSSDDGDETMLAVDAGARSVTAGESELPASMDVDSVNGSQQLGDEFHRQEQSQLSQNSINDIGQSTQDEDEITADVNATKPSADVGQPVTSTTRPFAARPAERSFDAFDIPSSPDELQLESQRPVTLPPAESHNDSGIRSALASENDDLSPLSSPPSSLASLDLGFGQNGDRREPEHPASRPEDLLPPLDIPEEIMRELSEPARRSLRQRNPIQLHPYLLEDAKYQSLMKARGVRPVRLPNVSQQQRNETDESQAQDSLEIPEPPSSSDPAAEFNLPSSSPVDPYERLPARSHSHTPRPVNHATSPLPASVSHRKSTHSAKRRKISHGGRRALSNVQVVITNRSSQGDQDDHSIFGHPPSPPRSGSLSSTQTMKAPSGFRFPRGFTPPALDTPVTESRSDLRNDVEESPLERRVTDDADERAELEALSDSERTSGEEKEPEDETTEVKRLQKRIKGVLPASWLRLDLKKQEEQQIKHKERQRKQELSRKLENAKGVARKITKPRNDGATSSSRPSLPSFSDQETDSDDNRPVEADPRKALAGLVGFDDPFDNVQDGDDIPEDNRIDYMWPSTSSKQRSSTGKTYSKRDKPKNHTECHETRRRPPLQRQMRITDSMSKPRREKGTRHASRRPPKLGILDAPDVIQRPRPAQPQFLRIAARQARSRRDQGRRSPTRKFFRLGTRKDTEDANSSLRDWRKGSIQQAKLVKTVKKQQQRQPLIDLSLNQNDHSEGSRSALPISASEPVNAHGERFDTGASLSGTESNGRISNTAARRETISNKQSAVKRHHDKWIVPRKFAISSLKRQDPRPAEFESVEASQTTITPSMFQQSLSALNRTYRHAHMPRRFKPSLTLDRFLSTTNSSPAALNSASQHAAEVIVNESSRPRPHVRPQARKRQPRRLDTYTTDHQQTPVLTLDDIDNVSIVSAGHPKASTPASKGLGTLKPAYSVDFNIAPLQPGTYFHDSSFIGSGKFSRSLNIQARNLDKDAGRHFIHIGDQSYQWSAWNDTVSSEFGLLFDAIMNEIENGKENDSTTEHDEGRTARTCKVEQLYRSVVEYATEKLWFLDTVDRAAFVDRCAGLISKLNDQITTFVPASPTCRRSCLWVSCYNAVFANQVLQIASHDLVSASTTDRALALLKVVLKQAAELIFSQPGLAEINSFSEANKARERREKGIHDEYPVISAYVALHHIIDNKHFPEDTSETSVVTGYLLPYVMHNERTKDVSALERVWRSIFTTLPLDEIDQFGIYQVGSRFSQAKTNWPLVRSLVLEVLDKYDVESEKQPVCLNNYCRVLFQRCYHLINSWGWRDCKPILDALFDFFAKNTLHNLKNEESFGSPTFLDELETGPSLEVLPGDPCFHIFLKIVGSGLRFMSRIHEKKRIRNFAWRLLPNHGRVYPKDKPLHHEDLDALRNHHDLLCTLFWAVPDGCRPRLETIRNLVEPTNSHRETCSISLRSWARLVRFKLSTDEDVAALNQFAEWHGYFATELVKQHALARSEVEAQGQAADTRFSKQLIESTISQNQKQIESLLSTALSGMNSALGIAPSLEHARVLISKLPLQRLFGLFNPKQSRVNRTVSETLEILISYTQKDESMASRPETASANEDSQEYGDWTGIEEMCVDSSDSPGLAVEHVDTVLHPAVSRLVSNCFGEDYCPEDAILLKVIDCWTAISHMLIRHRLRHWDSYVSPYGGDSWTALRSTMQTRKFTPYFLARCMERDSEFFAECKHQVLGMWVSSLVERSSMLKFQHYLTEVLLNQTPENPLFDNLPFSRAQSSDRYRITLEEFTERRLSLISSLLSNMREHLQLLDDVGDRELNTTRDQYRDLIENLMTSMKANYQELGNNAEATQSAYVTFVHSVVSFLQQHTPGICAVDKFFTEPTSFPLPATDPTYIVARLKSYGLRLSTGKVAKPLVVFIQSVSERAALDGQQAYLVDQLYASMGDIYEGGNPNRPTLRAFLLRSVFPAYIESAFSDVCGWILAGPILQAASRTFTDMLLYMDTTDTACISSVTEIFCTIFESSYRAMHLLVDHAGMIEEPTVLVTAASFFGMITSALPAIDYIDRNTDSGEVLMGQLQGFRQIALFAATSLLDPGMAVDPDSLDGPLDVFSARHSRPTATPRIFHEARGFATRELQTALRMNWSSHEGKYFTRRGQQLKEVQIDSLRGPDVAETAKAKFINSVEELFGTMQHLHLLPNEDI